MRRVRPLALALLLAGFTVMAARVQAAPQVYEIDPAHSRVEFTIRHIFSKVTGSFDKFHGTIHYDPDKPATATVKAEIDASSIDTDNERRDAHLRSADFFDVAKYPAITFAVTKVTPGEQGKFRLDGTLTMHGVSKPISLDAAYLGAGPDMGGVTRAGFEAAGKLDRKDYGILWNKALDQGTLLGDEVAIRIEIEGFVPDARSEAAKKDAPKAASAEKETKSTK